MTRLPRLALMLTAATLWAAPLAAATWRPGSDAELAAAIRDLEGRIATTSAKPRRRRWGTVATKGL